MLFLFSLASLKRKVPNFSQRPIFRTSSSLCSECGKVIIGTSYLHGNGKVQLEKALCFGSRCCLGGLCIVFSRKVFCESCQEDYRKKTEKLCMDCGEVINGTYYPHSNGKVEKKNSLYPARRCGCFMKVFCVPCHEEYKKKTRKLCSTCGEVISGTYYTRDNGKV